MEAPVQLPYLTIPKSSFSNYDKSIPEIADFFTPNNQPTNRSKADT